MEPVCCEFISSDYFHVLVKYFDIYTVLFEVFQEDTSIGFYILVNSLKPLLIPVIRPLLTAYLLHTKSIST